jgi:hypothetical protein
LLVLPAHARRELAAINGALNTELSSFLSRLLLHRARLIGPVDVVFLTRAAASNPRASASAFNRSNRNEKNRV